MRYDVLGSPAADHWRYRGDGRGRARAVIRRGNTSQLPRMPASEPGGRGPLRPVQRRPRLVPGPPAVEAEPDRRMVVGQPGHLRRQGLQVVLVQRVAISPSVRLAVALCLLHGAAGALLWLVPIPTLAKAVFTLAIAISLIYFLARDATL